LKGKKEKGKEEKSNNFTRSNNAKLHIGKIKIMDNTIIILHIVNKLRIEK
jgi:hypothetical protein